MTNTSIKRPALRAICVMLASAAFLGGASSGGGLANAAPPADQSGASVTNSAGGNAETRDYILPQQIHQGVAGQQPKVGISYPPGTGAGPIGASAKATINGALAKIQAIGEQTWSQSLTRLPLSSGVKTYLRYHAVINVLNRAAKLEGTAMSNLVTSYELLGATRSTAILAAHWIAILLF